MSILENQEKIIKEFERITSWEDKYKHLIDRGKKLQDIPPEFKTDKYKVKGCQSTVYLTARLENGKVFFEAISDAMIVNGLVSLLLEVYSGESPDTILATEPSFIEKIGLKTHLSPTRSNGLFAMIKQIKMYAYVFKATLK